MVNRSHTFATANQTEEKLKNFSAKENSPIMCLFLRVQNKNMFLQKRHQLVNEDFKTVNNEKSFFYC